MDENKNEVVEEVKPKRTRRTTKKEEVAEVSTETVVAEKKPAKRTTKKASSKSKAVEFAAVGKRKSSVARVRLSVGTGKITINKKDIEEYFDLETLKTIVKQPLVLTETLSNVDIIVNVYGGGNAGQAGAIRHGITRALLLYRPELRPELKKAGFITRDSRIKERKKYGLKKARKAPQFSKR